MVYPASYLLMIFVYRLNPDPNLFGKVIFDIIFFAIEIALFIPFLIYLKNKNPLTDLKKKQPLFNVIMILSILLGVIYLVYVGMSFKNTVKLLVLQVIFSILLGFKEEFSFRWIFMEFTDEILGSKTISLLFQAIPWSLYHVFFGEGTGRYVVGGLLTLVGAIGFGKVTQKYGSITYASFVHILIEFYAFFVLYGSFLLV